MKGIIEIHYKKNNIIHKKLISVLNSLNSVDNNGIVHYDCGSSVVAIETYEEIKQKIKEAQGK